MSEFALRFARNKAAILGLTILVSVALLALFAHVLYPAGPFNLAGKPLQPPWQNYLFGTDILGRDIAACIVYGARTSLLIAIVATLVAVTIGVIIGGVAGYFGGVIDSVLMRLTEVFQTIPAFLFAITIVAILGASISHVILAITIVSWPSIARLARGEFLSMKNREFVKACVSSGLGDFRIVSLHIFPNTTSSIIVAASLMTANAILIESSLAFLGLSDPNVMSWGLLIGASRAALRTAWWGCAIPGIAILFTVLAINLVGDGLNDSLNPRLRHR